MLLPETFMNYIFGNK